MSFWKPPLHYLTPGHVPALLLPAMAPAHLSSSSWCQRWLRSLGAAPQSSPSIGISGRPGTSSCTLSRWQTFLFSSPGKVVSGLSRVVYLQCACAWLPPLLSSPLLSLCSPWKMATVSPCHGTRAAGHVSAGSSWLQGQSWGRRSGCCQGCWGTWVGVCSSSPPSLWFEGVPPRVPWPRVLRGSRSPTRSAFGTPLPGTADPGDQLSGYLFCLESSQVFFLVQSCSICPKSTRQLDCQED